MTRPSLWTARDDARGERQSRREAPRLPNRELRTPRQVFTTLIRIYEQFNDVPRLLHRRTDGAAADIRSGDRLCAFLLCTRGRAIVGQWPTRTG